MNVYPCGHDTIPGFSGCPRHLFTPEDGDRLQRAWEEDEKKLTEGEDE